MFGWGTSKYRMFSDRDDRSGRSFSPTSLVVVCMLGGFTAGLLLVWTVRVEVAAQQPTSGVRDLYNAVSYAPAMPVFASGEGIVLNFVKPERVADFESVVRKLQNALESETVQRYSSVGELQVERVAEPAPDGTIVYLFLAPTAHRGGDYDMLLALNRAFPLECLDLFGRYLRATVSRQKIVRLIDIDPPEQ